MFRHRAPKTRCHFCFFSGSKVNKMAKIECIFIFIPQLHPTIWKYIFFLTLPLKTAIHKSQDNVQEKKLRPKKKCWLIAENKRKRKKNGEKCCNFAVNMSFKWKWRMQNNFEKEIETKKKTHKAHIEIVIRDHKHNGER